MRGETWMGMEERKSRNNSDCDLLEKMNVVGLALAEHYAPTRIHLLIFCYETGLGEEQSRLKL